MTTPAQDLVCRSCGAPLDRVMVDLGSSPLANSYLSAADLARAELFLPLVRLRLRALLALPVAGVRDAGGDLHRLRLFLLLLDQLARACPPLRRRDDAALRPRDRRARSSRSPRTTATCCGTSSSAASRCSASSRRPTSPRRRASWASRPRSVSSAARPPGSSSARGLRAPISCSATTCSPTSPTSTTSSAAWRSCSRPTAS